MPRPKSIAPSSSTLPADSFSPQTFKDGGALPKLLVFDLDYTLWPFWVDTHVSPPLKVREKGRRVVDRFGESFAFYQDVPQILQDARTLGVLVGAASRTAAPDLAREMLKSLVFQPADRRALDYFDYLQIYPGGSSLVLPVVFSPFEAEFCGLVLVESLCLVLILWGFTLVGTGSKTTHFARLQKQTGLSYDEMLFFDDEARNKNVEELGVVMYLVRDGVTRDVVDRGVREWRRRVGKEGKDKDRMIDG